MPISPAALVHERIGLAHVDDATPYAYIMFRRFTSVCHGQCPIESTRPSRPPAPTFPLVGLPEQARHGVVVTAGAHDVGIRNQEGKSTCDGAGGDGVERRALVQDPPGAEALDLGLCVCLEMIQMRSVRHRSYRPIHIAHEIQSIDRSIDHTTTPTHLGVARGRVVHDGEGPARKEEVGAFHAADGAPE